MPPFGSNDEFVSISLKKILGKAYILSQFPQLLNLVPTLTTVSIVNGELKRYDDLKSCYINIGAFLTIQPQFLQDDDRIALPSTDAILLRKVLGMSTKTK